MDTTQFFNSNEGEKKAHVSPEGQDKNEEAPKQTTQNEKQADTGIDAATTFTADHEQDLDDLVHSRGRLENDKDKLNPNDR